MFNENPPPDYDMVVVAAEEPDRRFLFLKRWHVHVSRFRLQPEYTLGTCKG